MTSKAISNFSSMISRSKAPISRQASDAQHILPQDTETGVRPHSGKELDCSQFVFWIISSENNGM